MTRILAILFSATTVVLATALGATWWFAYQLMQSTNPPPPEPLPVLLPSPQVSPLQVRYQVDLPGRGEIFPALASSNARDYWPVAVLTISNASDGPVLQTISAEIPEWSRRSTTSLIVGPRETRVVHINPELLPQAYQNTEIRRALLELRASAPGKQPGFDQARPARGRGSGRDSCRVGTRLAARTPGDGDEAQSTERRLMAQGLTFDTGMLISLERRKQRAWEVYRRARGRHAPVTIPAPVLGQWWRGRTELRQAIVDSAHVEPLTERIAILAGEALAVVTDAGTVDAFVMTVAALLSRHARPGEAQIREALSQNMCRCGTYQRILSAVDRASKTIPRDGR